METAIFDSASGSSANSTTAGSVYAGFCVCAAILKWGSLTPVRSMYAESNTCIGIIGERPSNRTANSTLISCIRG